MLHPKLLESILKLKGIYIKGCIAAILSTALFTSPALILGKIIDLLKASELNQTELIKWLVSWFILSALSALFLYYQRYWIISSSRKIEHDLRSEFYALLQRQRRVTLDDFSTGEIISTFSNDMDRIRDLMGPAILHGLRSIFILFYSFAIMFYYSPTLTIYVAIPLIAIPLITPYILKILDKTFTQVQDRLSDLNMTAQESFSGISIVKNFGVEKELIQEFYDTACNLKKTNVKASIQTGMLWPLLSFLSGTGVAVLLFIGGPMIYQNEISIGQFSAIAILLVQLRFPLIIIGWVITLVIRGHSASKIFFHYYDTLEDKKILNDFNKPFLKKEIQSIETRMLNFSYNNAKSNKNYALKNISIRINKGETLGVVGPVGAGKTSLAQALTGIYQHDENMVYINQEDANSWAYPERIQAFSMVPQDNFLFSSTIKENIAFENHQNKKIIDEACDWSQFTKDLPQIKNGLNAYLGERGINLSGGQKQRVSLARAYLSNAEIMILDDSLSALDSETENQILANIQKTRKDKINILISHRLSTVEKADHIIVLQDGAITEQGTHLELIKNKGYYQHTYLQQALELQLEKE